MVYLGKGIYTLPTAAKILKINPKKVRRWINGYTYNKNEVNRFVEPLVETEFKNDSNNVIISFLDLMELRLINAFIKYGLSIQKIRKAAITASRLLNTDHPFAIQKMFTDGKSIFAKIAQEENDTSLLDLIDKQYQFEEIIESVLYERIDFNAEDLAERWWPLGRDKDIVLDPSRNMGQPILDKYNIRTGLIYDLYKTKHSINEISDWYELDRNSIESAINFESEFAA